MWSALAGGDGEVLLRSERVRVIAPSPYHALRAIVLDATSEPELTVREAVDAVLPHNEVRRRVIEDAGGRLDFAPHGFEERFRFPVMVRDPGWAAEDSRPARDASTIAVTEPEDLAVAERIMFAVFPPARVDAEMSGRIQPPRVLGIDGWCVWLTHRSGVPAGAAYTYHDGESVGVYQVATLPEHRGNGVARATMAAVLTGTTMCPSRSPRRTMAGRSTSGSGSVPSTRRSGGYRGLMPIPTGDDRGPWLR